MARDRSVDSWPADACSGAARTIDTRVIFRRPGGFLLIVRRFLSAIPLIVLWLAAGATPAGAHAILVHSSIADQPVAADAAATVTLRFNAGIEVGLSQAHLVDAQHAERPLSVAPGKSKGEMIVNMPALRPGLYGLKYRVLAADGHLSDGILRFTVAATR